MLSLLLLAAAWPLARAGPACASAGRRALIVHPSDEVQAALVTARCELQALDSSPDVLDVRALALDEVISFPPVAALDLSFCQIQSLEDATFPSALESLGIDFPPTLKELNLSFNAIVSIARGRFPWKLDLRGNPLTELEQRCRHAVAVKVVVLGTELCVLEDVDFDRIYGNQTATSGSVSDSDDIQSLSWTFLIAGILAVSTIVAGIIAMFSWKHQQLRKRMRAALQSSGRLSLSDTILAAMGFDDQLFALRIESGDIRVLHVLGKAGCGMLYLAEFVTLKKILPELSTLNSSSLTTFIQEIQLMAHLEHPNIIAFFGVSWTSISDISMVTEFLPNGDLGTLLRVDRDRAQSFQSRRLHWFKVETSFASTLAQGFSAVEIVAKVVTDDSRPEMGTDCPEDVQKFALKCMHRDPETRPSAREAHRVFRALRDGSRLSTL
ncbi:hypothetical protein PybrP1_005518 [[Pythium] brassicae (nom. inval.)]|nr:hypothetical protein PybrP1_005518 [[Pythium] brassicae (nom. inval.)]